MFCLFFKEFVNEWKNIAQCKYPYEVSCWKGCDEEKTEGFLVCGFDLGFESLREEFQEHPIAITCKGNYCIIEADVVVPKAQLQNITKELRNLPHCILKDTHEWTHVYHLHPECIVRIGEVSLVLDRLVDVLDKIEW